MKPTSIMVDGNEAAALVAYLLNEVIAIYPITPASPMGELADTWSQMEKPNLFGLVPRVIEMQSEGGAAGAVHGALQGGSLTTTFTASQGLLLMIPNMYKIAGELSPCVIHVAARTLATHALSIFGDHSDVMATRQTGWAMLCASSVQEAQDFAVLAQLASLATRVPFLHFFDGFRTSHEINKIESLSEDDLRTLLDPRTIEAHRRNGLDPDRPVLRGTAQNPDVFFQSREACNTFYDAVPERLQAAMDVFAHRTGRQYHLFDYHGAPDAERVLILMGSGVGAAMEMVEALAAKGEKVGLLVVRLYRPFATATFIEALPTTVREIAVLDRTKEPGAIGEPLYQDVVTALVEGWPADRGPLPRVLGGRYGLSSKDFTPAMVAAVFRELASPTAKRHFTIGIHDDVTHLSLAWDAEDWSEPADVTRAVFYGLGSDGTVGANKNTIKIIGDDTDFFAQAYFVYDSKKAGAMTVSHLRFGSKPIRSTYLIRQANFVACHQFHFLDRVDVLGVAEPGATFLLNSPYGPDEVWDRLPIEVQTTIHEKQLKLYIIDASRIAEDCGMRGRSNTVLQTCFFAISGVLPREEAIAAIKRSIVKSYGKRGQTVVDRNFAAVDATLENLHPVPLPDQVTATRRRNELVPPSAPDFVQRVTRMILEGKGDLLPVSAFPVDGTYPTGTAKFEKRSIAPEIPIWDASLCIECGLCSLVCPHAAIRVKVFPEEQLASAPQSYPTRDSGMFSGQKLAIQVAPDDCTGCGLCVAACPARSKEVARHKAINMQPKLDHLAREREWFEFFESIPSIDRRQVQPQTVKGSQLLEPLFEYSGACGGCGETMYLKLMSQLFGDRAVIANATGCSSIYGANLPTTPWTTNAEGRGPAWANSLFEDNAEFGLGLRLALDQKRARAVQLLRELASNLGDSCVSALIEARQCDEAAIHEQRARVVDLRRRLSGIDDPQARELELLVDCLVHRSVWIIGGDGWAYDIGFGGLDHVLSTHSDINVLVLDTEVYSNTGGQCSKATPRAAVAKFAAAGKAVGKKDLAMIMMAYGHVYVAQIAVAANPAQAHRAFLEAESYPGPSLILSYSQCIAHGIDMGTGIDQQKDAVATGYWPLFRYDPRLAKLGQHAFQLDSKPPRKRFQELAAKQARFSMLAGSDPARSKMLLDMAQRDIDARWHLYEQLAGIDRDVQDGNPERIS